VKSSTAITEREVELMRDKAAKYKRLLSAALECRRGTGAAAVAAQLLRVNPDVQTAWNIRREASASSVPSPESCEEELTLSAEGIKKNPKSYGAWHQREWVAEQAGWTVDCASELALCARLLQLDARNFHCWNYRRAVATRAQADPESELEFATRMIEANFSNYSAFHHRSVYVRQLKLSPELKQGQVESEFSLTESAIFTEPDDQSAWWYRRFLYSWLDERTDLKASEDIEKDSEYRHRQWRDSVLSTQNSLLRTLLEMEPDSKWAMLELLLVADKMEDGDNISSIRSASNTSEERVRYLERLEALDPMHRHRYRYLLAKIL
jgi:geranylgeranyl transferase type-2 subunit alpha